MRDVPSIWWLFDGDVHLLQILWSFPASGLGSSLRSRQVLLADPLRVFIAGTGLVQQSVCKTPGPSILNYCNTNTTSI